jgi:hypothetical protein
MRAILCGALLVTACQEPRFRAHFPDSDYYGQDWHAILGSVPTDTTWLDEAGAAKLQVIRETLVFPRAGQDSLDALIGGVRAAQVLHDGRVAILGSNGYLLITQGDKAKVLARRGEGPGELVGPEWLRVLKDSTLIVWDGTTRRLSSFHPDSGFIQAVPVRQDQVESRLVYPSTSRGDGIVYARVRPDFPSSDGVHLLRGDLVELQPDGRVGTTEMKGAPNSELHLEHVRAPDGGSRGIAMFTPPFARHGDVLAGASVTCYAWTGSDAIPCRSVSASGWWLYRDSGSARPATSQDMRVLLDSFYLVGISPGRRASQEEAVVSMPRADSMPRWGRAYLDIDDVLWLPRYAVVPDSVQKVLIVDSTGVRSVATLQRSDRIRWARGSRVLVQRTGEDGILRLVMVELRDT